MDTQKKILNNNCCFISNGRKRKLKKTNEFPHKQKHQIFYSNFKDEILTSTRQSL